MGTYSLPTTYRVVIVVALVVVAPTAGPLADTARAAAGDDQTFAVAQGTSCYVASTYENSSQNVTTFYDYRNPYPSITGRPAASTYSSYGTDRFQRDRQSALLFYAGPDNTSMVVVHGRRGDEVGGSTANYRITGLPDGSWAVRDDEYPFMDDEWDIGASTTTVDWKWADNRTDGGAYRGLDSLSRPIVIRPQYNERAPSWGEWNYSGSEGHRVTDWVLYGGDGTERSLALDRRVFIHAGGCVESDVSASLGAPDDPAAGENVTLDASATTAAGTVAGYEWDFDADGEVDAVTERPTVSHSFAEEREYTVRVTAFDTYGNGDTAEVAFVVGEPYAPDATLSASPSTVTVNQSVTLDASGSTDNGTIVRYDWDLDGDGTVEVNTTEPTLTTAFESAGEREVTVTAVDDTNETGSASVTVEVTPDQPPSASLTGPTDVAVGEEVTLDASDTTDDREIARYEWDVDGDGTVDANTTEPTYSAAYEEAGTVAATVTAVDSAGQTDTTSTTVRVGVTASLSAPAEALVTRTITLDASDSTIGGDGVTYRWDVDGDGSVEVNTTEPTYSVAYEEPGDYTARVVVTDGANITDEATASVAVEARAALSVPESVPVGESVTLDASDSTIGGSNVTYEWDLDGDGTFETNASASPTIDHAYTETGNVTPSVRVTSDAGETLTASATISVREPDPSIDASATEFEADRAVSFSADAGTVSGSSVAYRWQFGDGSTARGQSVQHAYAGSGQYTVTLSVLMGGSAIASTDLPVNVTESSDPPDDGSSGGNSGGSSGGSSGGNSGGSSGGSSGGTSGGSAGGSTGGSAGGASAGATEAADDGPSTADLEPNYTNVTASVSDTELVAGDTLVVTASVSNVGNGTGTKTIEFEVDGEQVDSRQFTLEPNQSRTVRFTWTFDEPDIYSVEIDREVRYLIDVSPPQPNVSVTELTVSDRTPAAGDEITFTAVVRNDGRAAGSTAVGLQLFNETVAAENVTVQPGSSTRVTFTRRIASGGEYTASVGNRTIEITVDSTSATPGGDETGGTGGVTSTTTPGFGPLATVLALAGAAALLARTRSREHGR